MRVLQIHEEPLRNSALHLMPHHEREVAMERLAGLLQERLYLLVKDTPERLKLPLGRLACFTEPYKNKNELQIIGAVPEGWRGFKAKYPVCDNSGQTGPLHQLALEGAACREAVAEINDWFDPAAIVTDPYFRFITNSKTRQLTGNDCRAIDSKLAADESFPRDHVLGDPVLTLKTGSLPEETVILPIRHLADLAMRRAA